MVKYGKLWYAEGKHGIAMADVFAPGF
jgi:hypothetical protein